MKTPAKRNNYDLSHFCMNVGAIGCLQTLASVPVIAGDSMALDLNAVFRLSQLRRPLYLDAQVDLFAFFVPHRHIYSNWQEYIEAGIDEAVNLGTETVNASYESHSLGHHLNVGTACPTWLPHGYAQIWNNYFADPTDGTSLDHDDMVTTVSANLMYYGQPCAYLKKAWNTMVTAETGTSDYRVALTDGNTTLDLLEFVKQKGYYKSELKREWFGQRYSDIIEQVFGGRVPDDAEPKPTLLMRNTNYLSGYESDGSSGDAMGLFQARSTGVANLRFPWRFFPEHGTLWIMALVRFPSVNYWYSHYLTLPANAEPTYKQMAGDPDVLNVEPPMTVTDGDLWYKDGGANALGKVPYAFWLREHTDFVHPFYVTLSGHPFLNIGPDTKAACVYPSATTYDDIFASSQLKHWQCQAHIGLQSKRVIPDPRVNIFAGSN